MNEKQIFYEDLEIARAIIGRDERVTREYFYKKCYPLFKSIYNNYYTDCATVKELIDEIYILILVSNKNTGKCQLENYRGESTLSSWLKIVSLYYCYKRYKLKQRMPNYEPIQKYHEKDDDAGDRFSKIIPSIEIDFENLNRQDAMTILNMMPNKRYRNIIVMRYLELKTNEETAEALGMTMDNYYNKHKLAKEQYERIWREEVQNG